MKVIDIHTHPIFFGENAKPAETRKMIQREKKQGFIHVVALPDVLRYGRLPDEKQSRILNDEMISIVKIGKGFVTGFCGLNPKLGEKAVRAEVDRCVGEGTLRGLKLEVSCNALDPDMRWVMEAAEAHDVPILQHTWNQLYKSPRAYHSDPEDTCALARKWPNVRIIMAHLTGCGIRGIRAARGIDNMVVDTSGGAPEAGLVEYAVKELGDRRVVYGSDWPIRDLPTAVGRITGSAISSRAKQRILHDNAAEFLRL
mgnify:FL=1